LSPVADLTLLAPGIATAMLGDVSPDEIMLLQLAVDPPRLWGAPVRRRLK